MHPAGRYVRYVNVTHTPTAGAQLQNLKIQNPILKAKIGTIPSHPCHPMRLGKLD